MDLFILLFHTSMHDDDCNEISEQFCHSDSRDDVYREATTHGNFDPNGMDSDISLFGQ